MKYYDFYQYSTISSLMSGNFKGTITFQELLKKGNFGIGTFNALDGELIVLDGIAYQMTSNGQIKEVTANMTSPFATLTYFESSTQLEVKDVTYEQLETILLKNFPSLNMFYAFKITGEFQTVTLRTVSKQDKPYPSLVTAASMATNITLNQVNGTIIGFWTPNFANTIGVDGFHCHFINTNKTQGGHVFNFKTNNIVIEICYLNKMELVLPTNNEYLNYTIDNKQLQDNISKAESNRN